MSLEELQPIPGLAWFHVADPNSAALDELARRFQLHALEIDDCRHPPQRTKLEEHEPYLFVVLKHLHSVEHHEIEFDDFDIFVGRDFIVTVSHAEPTLIDRVRTRLTQQPSTRVDRVFYAVCDEIVDAYLLLLDHISDKIEEVEDQVLTCPDPEILSRILALKRALIEFRRVAAGTREVVNSAMRREQGILGDDLDPYFRDLYDHVIRAVDLIESYRDLLSGSLDIYLSAVANRTNEVMKVLTIYGTVSIPLVVITGFFGMNLKLPWMDKPHGTWLAVGLMVLSTVVVLAYFRRKHWF